MKKFILLMLTLFFIYGMACSAEAATYYVRPSGGSKTQCTGLANVDYPGSGTGQACAFRSPATALIPGDTVLTGSDTLIVADGTYELDYGGDDVPTSGGSCNSAARAFCLPASVPDGAKIYGENYANCDNIAATSKPTFVGGSGQHNTLRMGSNTEIRCIAITDDSDCTRDGVYAGPEAHQCDRDCTDGFCEGATRLLTLDNSTDVLLENVDLYGGAHYGLNVWRSGNITIRNSDIIGNCFAGINSDDGVYLPDGSQSPDDLTGDWVLTDNRIMWNGCTLHNPLVDTSDPAAEANMRWCASQSNSGFGDGIGLGDGSIGDSWTITGGEYSYNTSDGIDLLHGQGPATVRRVVIQGNAGNAFKANAGSLIENSLVVNNCDFFRGKSYMMTTDGGGTVRGFDHCRQRGNAIEFKAADNKVGLQMYGNTVIGYGDVFLSNTGTCSSGGQNTILKNNIFATGLEQTQNGNSVPGELTSFYYCSYPGPDSSCRCNNHQLTMADNIIHGFKGGTVPPGTRIQSDDPAFNSGAVPDEYESMDFDATLSVSSVARNAGDETVPMTAVDVNNFARGASWDLGSYEYDTAGGSDPCDDTDCELCGSSSACNASALGCYVWEGSTPACQATEETCADYIGKCTDQTACEGQGYYWYNSTCNATPEGCSTTCSACTDATECAGSAQRCSYIASTCRDISLVTSSGSSSSWTITGEEYSITTDGGEYWNGLTFPNVSTTDVILGSKIFTRLVGGGVYSVPDTSPSALSADTSVYVSYTASGNITGSSTDYGDYSYWATFFRDRVVLRVESVESPDSGNTGIRMSWDEDLRGSAGGSTLLVGDAYRYKESGGAWATESLDGTAPSGGTLLLPAAKQMILDAGATDGVWVQIATDLTNTNFTTVTIAESNSYDDVSLLVTPVVGTTYKNTNLNLFFASNSYQDATVDEYYDDWGTPATLTADTGTINTSATGDDDADGFNERYGWYEVTATGAGLMVIDVPNDGITRKTPVFKISSAVLDEYVVKINSVTLTEGVDYIITSEADETDVGTNVRVLQLLADYGSGITDLELTASAVCASDPDYCLTEGDCTGASWYWYNAQCNAEAEPAEAVKATMSGGGCAMKGNATLE